MAVPLDSAVQNLNQGSVFHEYDTDREVSRQRFRQFQYKEAAGPRDAFKKLWELCRQWLKPNTGCLEQILEVLVLEQLMQILPIEIQNSMRPFSMKNREAVLALMEFLQTKTDVSEQQVRKEFGILVIRPKEVAEAAGTGLDIYFCVFSQSQDFTTGIFIFLFCWNQHVGQWFSTHCTHSPTYNKYFIMSS